MQLLGRLVFEVSLYLYQKQENLHGGPVDDPTLPGESVPRAKRTVSALQGVPFVRSFWVVSVRARGRRELREGKSRGKEAASGRRAPRRIGKCILLGYVIGQRERKTERTQKLTGDLITTLLIADVFLHLIYSSSLHLPNFENLQLQRYLVPRHKTSSCATPIGNQILISPQSQISIMQAQKIIYQGRLKRGRSPRRELGRHNT